jgi:hypothetical protein
MQRALTFLALLLPSFIVWVVPAPASAQNATIAFTYTDEVSALDRQLIEQAVWFARDAYTELLGSDIKSALTVTVVYDETFQSPHGVGDQESIYLNAAVFSGASSLSETVSVVHEFFHIWQLSNSEVSLSEMESLGPFWLLEGSAEYIAYWTMAEAGLVDHDVVHEAFVERANGDGPRSTQSPVDLPELSAMESQAAMAAPGAACCSMHLAALGVEMLVEETGPEAIGTYYSELKNSADYGGTWEGVFKAAFGQSPEAFYEAFEAQRDEMLTESEPGLSPLLEPAVFNEAPAEVVLDELPATVERGTQLIVLGHTDPGAQCLMTITDPVGAELVSYPSYADYYGLVFWLWGVDETVDPGIAILSASCNGTPVETEIEVT